MSSDRPKPTKREQTPAAQEEDLVVELDVAKEPRTTDGSRPDFVVRRVIRQGSKAQWYCSANQADERMKRFADEIKTARRTNGWNQTEAAEKCGISQPQWSHLEAGELEPLPGKVFEFERALGLPAGQLSRHLGYHQHGGDDRELFTQVAEKLDELLINGALAVETVMEQDSGATWLQNFLEKADRIGVDVIAALAKVSGSLVDTLNIAVDQAMPKVFRMKQAEMSKLSSRLISLATDDDGSSIHSLVNGYKPRKRPHPEALKQFELGWIDSPWDEPIGGTTMDNDNL